MINELPDPVLTPVYRLKAVLDTPLADGMFTGGELNGNLLPGGSAGWQFVLPDGQERLARSATPCGPTAGLYSTSKR